MVWRVTPANSRKTESQRGARIPKQQPPVMTQSGFRGGTGRLLTLIVCIARIIGPNCLSDSFKSLSEIEQPQALNLKCTAPQNIRQPAPTLAQTAVLGEPIQGAIEIAAPDRSVVSPQHPGRYPPVITCHADLSESGSP